jgi:hypothetical protein
MSLYANGLRAQHHISGKTTFRTLCAGAHKMRESRLSGSEGGAILISRPYPYPQLPLPDGGRGATHPTSRFIS